MKKIVKMATLIMSLLIGTMTYGAEKILVGTNAEYKPYEYLENGKLTGFDIEFMEKIAKDAGYEVEWKNLSFDGLIPALQMKKIDVVIADMSATEERAKAVNFTIPYIKTGKASTNAIVVAENSTIAKKEDIKGKNVGAQLATIQEDMAKSLGGIIKPYNNFTSALMAIQQGKLDAVVIANDAAEGYLKNMKGLKIAVRVEEGMSKAAIAVGKENKEIVEKFNKAILNFKETPEYDALYKKYFPEGVKE